MLRSIDDEIIGAFDIAEALRKSGDRSENCTKSAYIGYVNTIVYGREKGLSWQRLGDIYYDGTYVEKKKDGLSTVIEKPIRQAAWMIMKMEAILVSWEHACFMVKVLIKILSWQNIFLTSAYYSFWYPEDDEQAILTESLLSSIGTLTECYLIDGNSLMEEDNVLEDTASEWLSERPKYIKASAKRT